MKTIAILSQKGGAGKTTLAVNLATASVLKNKTAAVIDLDPQGSAYGWGKSRENEEPPVVVAQAISLPDVIEKAKTSGVDLCIIDTAPHSQNEALEAAQICDLILIPCRPSILDLRAIKATIQIAKLADKQAVVILNVVPSRGTAAEEARDAIKVYDVKVSPCHMGDRAAYKHSMTAGLGVMEYEPKGKATEEIMKLYKWVCRQVDK